MCFDCVLDRLRIYKLGAMMNWTPSHWVCDPRTLIKLEQLNLSPGAEFCIATTAIEYADDLFGRTLNELCEIVPYDIAIEIQAAVYWYNQNLVSGGASSDTDDDIAEENADIAVRCAAAARQSAFNARTTELIEMIKDGRKITKDGRIYIVDGMGNDYQINTEMFQRNGMQGLAREVYQAQEARIAAQAPGDSDEGRCP
jgi:hypothetical protein